jgi:hypothetical protein
MRTVEVGFVVGLALLVLAGLVVGFFSIVGWDFVHTKLRKEKKEDVR